MFDIFKSAFTPLGPVTFENNQGETDTTALTENDCCWCYPNTIANSACDSHIEAMATQAVEEHKSRRNRR